MKITKEMLVKERDSIISHRDESMRKVEQATGALLLIDFLIEKIDSVEFPTEINSNK